MRTEFDRKTKRAAWDRCQGLCEGKSAAGVRCGLPLHYGKYTYDHIIPDWMGGPATLGNCQVIGWCCDKPKTARDRGDIAKVKRIRDRAIGALKARRVLIGGRASKWKKRMDGTIVLRENN